MVILVILQSCGNQKAPGTIKVNSLRSSQGYKFRKKKMKWCHRLGEAQEVYDY